MDPLSIIAFSATILEVGLRVSTQMNGVITTWRTADPVILVLANELSDLNLVLDHVSHTCEAIRGSSGASKDSQRSAFLGTFNSSLHQAYNLLHELEDLVLEMGGMSSVKRKYTWLKKNTVASKLQGRLRDVRLRITELLISYNAFSVSRIEMQISAVQATMQQTIEPTALVAATPQRQVQEMLEQLISCQGGGLTSGLVPDDRASSHPTRRGVPSHALTVGRVDDNQRSTRPIQIVARPRRRVCATKCPCRCHQRGDQSVRFMSNYFGRLFVGYNGIPILSPICSDSSCKARGKISIEVSYVFPAWFLSHSINAFFTQAGGGGPSAGLFLAKRIAWKPGTAHFAAYMGDVQSLERMLEEDPYSINYVTEDGRPPLHFAIMQANYSLAGFLLERGADPYLENDYGSSGRIMLARSYMYLSAKERAESWIQEEITMLVPLGELLDDLPVITKAVTGILPIDATDILSRDMPTVSKMLNEPDFSGNTPLFWAVQHRDLKAVKALLKAGVDPNKGNVKGTTVPLCGTCGCPTHGSKSFGEDIFDELLKAGADIHRRNVFGFEPIHVGCEGGDVEFVRKLVAAGADPNCYTEEGMSGSREPGTLIAAYGNFVDVLEFLHEAGADLNARCSLGETPLIAAVSTNSHECIQFLLDQGVDHLVSNRDHYNILHCAAKTGDARTLSILERGSRKLWGLDPTKRTDADATPQEIFEQSAHESAELCLAWARLVELLQKVNSGSFADGCETRLGGNESVLKSVEGGWSEMESPWVGSDGEFEEDEFYDVVERR